MVYDERGITRNEFRRLVGQYHRMSWRPAHQAAASRQAQIAPRCRRPILEARYGSGMLPEVGHHAANRYPFYRGLRTSR